MCVCALCVVEGRTVQTLDFPVAIDCSISELGLAHLRTFWGRNYLNFLGAKVGVLSSHFGCASS